MIFSENRCPLFRIMLLVALELDAALLDHVAPALALGRDQ
jgi:hypothetical protein